MKDYFAYGSNMSAQQMAQRCRGSSKRGNACLKEFKFIINSHGVATVVRETNSAVYGVIWSIDTNDEAELDRYEGVHNGIYEKMLLEVIADNQTQPVRSLVYIAADSSLGSPRLGYLELVIEAAKVQGLPQTYIGEIARWLQTDD